MGEVKQILAKFMDGISEQQIHDLIKGYANLVNHVEHMKSFRWGKDVSIENLLQGFTHVFESTFETTQDIATYVSHPSHVEFAPVFLDQLDKVLIIDLQTYNSRAMSILHVVVIFDMHKRMTYE